MDSYGYLHIAGEVANHTADNLQFVQISANIFDSGNQPIASGYAKTALSTLPAQDKACFELIMEEPAGAAYYQLETPTYSTGGVPLPPLTVINRQGVYDPEFRLVRSDRSGAERQWQGSEKCQPGWDAV